MSINEDYKSKIEVIKKITDDQIKVPGTIPVGIYIQEAENLYRWCQFDKEILTAKGLDWTVVEDMPIRCRALKEAETNWQRAQLMRKKAGDIWIKEYPKGYDLRNELIHHFNYAFRDKSSLIKKVREIADSSAKNGIIDGLYDLNVLGHVNRYLLEKIGFDFTLLDLAVKISNDLDAKKEAASWNSVDYVVSKKTRNQSYTHLKKAVDMVYDYGRYVFWQDSARLKGYSSNHLRLKRKAFKIKHNVPALESEPVQLTIDI